MHLQSNYDHTSAEYRRRHQHLPAADSEGKGVDMRPKMRFSISDNRPSLQVVSNSGQNLQRLEIRQTFLNWKCSCSIPYRWNFG